MFRLSKVICLQSVLSKCGVIPYYLPNFYFLMHESMWSDNDEFIAIVIVFSIDEINYVVHFITKNMLISLLTMTIFLTSNNI